MSELLYDKMSEERIISTLRELKATWYGKTPSKYYFALGHAIRFFEANAPQPTDAVDDEDRCELCGGTDFDYLHCLSCGAKNPHRS